MAYHPRGSRGIWDFAPQKQRDTYFVVLPWLSMLLLLHNSTVIVVEMVALLRLFSAAALQVRDS